MAMVDFSQYSTLKPTSSFYISTTAGTRPGSRVTTTTTSSAASQALGGQVFKTIIVIYYVMSVKIASLVAGNVVTFLQP